jgi:hypothetical protein
MRIIELSFYFACWFKHLHHHATEGGHSEARDITEGQDKGTEGGTREEEGRWDRTGEGKGRGSNEENDGGYTC